MSNMGGVIRSVSKVYNYMISVAEVNQNYSKESSPILIHYVMEKPWNVKFPYKTDYPYFKLMWRLGRKMELESFIFFIDYIEYIN